MRVVRRRALEEVELLMPVSNGGNSSRRSNSEQVYHDLSGRVEKPNPGQNIRPGFYQKQNDFSHRLTDGRSTPSKAARAATAGRGAAPIGGGFAAGGFGGE